LEKQIPALKEKLTTAESNVKTTQGDLDKAKGDVRAAKAQLASSQDELKTANADLATAKESLSAETSKVADIQAKFDADEKKIADMGTPGTSSTDTTAVNPLAAPLQDAQNKVQELQQVNQTLTGKVMEAQNKEKEDAAKLAHYVGQVNAKGLQGQVLAVNGAYNFVVLSIGDRQGVVMNAQMIVLRGDRMVAKIKITSVEPSTSIADIIPGTGSREFQVQPGDRVVYSGA